MPEEDKLALINGLPKAAPATSHWIRDLGGIVAILVAIGGVYGTLRSINDKAEADKATASFNLQAEKTKLDIAVAQIKAQDTANTLLRDQHISDNDLQKANHLADQTHQDSLAANQQLISDRANLSLLISKMLSADKSSVGEMASLFNYVNRDGQSNTIIENAVLVRLEEPHSLEEIDLGFRVLEKIGSSAIDITAEANRDARRKYDA